MKQTKSEVLKVRLEKELVFFIQKKAEKENLTLSAVVRNCVKKELLKAAKKGAALQ